MVVQIQFLWNVRQTKNWLIVGKIRRTRIRAIVVFAREEERKREEVEEDCYSGGKNQQLNTVSYRPRRKSAFQLSVRASRRSARSRTWMVAISA